jgi:hypothetical protein
LQICSLHFKKSEDERTQGTGEEDMSAREAGSTPAISISYKCWQVGEEVLECRTCCRW